METLFQSFTKNLMFTVGVNAWSVALIAAVVALFWADAPRVPLFLIALPVYFMSFDHAFPFGSLTFGSFFIVALWIEIARPGPASDKEGPHPAEAPDPGAEAG
ncbi:MAG: hypothetical protein LC751_15955 [Actinobacteria bacterium]|nr:hypothetical protein [Actinomycetota bacterium]